MQRVTSLFKEVQKFLAPLGVKQDFKDFINILFNWQKIFDDEIAIYTSPNKFQKTKKGRALEVSVFNSVMGAELYYRKKEMISKINNLLAEDKVVDIIFLVKKQKADIYKKKKTDNTHRQQECEATKIITNPELRDSLDKLYNSIKEIHE